MNAPSHVVRTHRGVVVVELPLRLTNPLNGSWGHWSVKSKARRQIRDACLLALRAPLASFREALATPVASGPRNPRLWSELTQVAVAVTRIAPRALDRHDGLPASAKPVVDAVADALGIDDADERLVVSYAQERGKPRQYAVRVTVEAR